MQNYLSKQKNTNYQRKQTTNQTSTSVMNKKKTLPIKKTQPQLEICLILLVFRLILSRRFHTPFVSAFKHF